MSFIVLAIQQRADGSEETRYSSVEFDTEFEASLHADVIKATWLDSNMRFDVVEAGGQKEEGTVVYTNAPPDYDYSYVEVVDPEYAEYTGNGGTHPIFRKIKIHAPTDKERAYRVDYQCGRYASGLYTSLSQEDFDRAVELDTIAILPEVPGPSPSGALCADCLAPASIDDVGTVCSQCGRGIVIGSSLEDHNG